MELNLDKFSPAAAELRSMAEKARLITRESLPEEVHEMRSILRSTRTNITKTGKAMREDAIKFQKDVIAKEKELVGIIEPEEDRISVIEDEIEIVRQREERRASLPHRKERLAAIGDGFEISDDEILDMDGPAFEGHCNMRVANKNEADRLALQAEKRKVEEEQLKLQREKEMQEREERARQDERDRVAREEEARRERERREKEEAEAKAKQEQERLEQEEKYQAFLKENGYDEVASRDFVINRDYLAKEVRLYKLVGVFKIK